MTTSSHMIRLLINAAWRMSRGHPTCATGQPCRALEQFTLNERHPHK